MAKRIRRLDWSTIPNRCARGHPLNSKTIRYDRGYAQCRFCKEEQARESYDPEKERLKYLKRKARKKMAREFKDYDAIFADDRAQTMNNIEKQCGKIPVEDWIDKKSWLEFMPDWAHIEFSQEVITNAVYNVPHDSEQWQKFRVGLKGLVTEAKLYCLAWYIGQQNTVLRHCRVQNYLGALVRGGQLNTKYEIQR